MNTRTDREGRVMFWTDQAGDVLEVVDLDIDRGERIYVRVNGVAFEPTPAQRIELARALVDGLPGVRIEERDLALDAHHDALRVRREIFAEKYMQESDGGGAGALDETDLHALFAALVAVGAVRP